MGEVERRHPDAICEECPLAKTSIRRFVPSFGPDRADIAVIGEAPGRNETNDGRPFTGVSGKLLHRILNSHGIDPGGVFFTNACLCRPSGNATPSAAAIRACRPRLLRELDDRGITKVVALGNTAAETTLGRKTKITQERVGPPSPSKACGDRLVIPTVHPAAAFRNPGHYPDIVADIGKLKGSTQRWKEPEIEVIDDEEGGYEWLLEQLETKSREVYTFDIETGYEKDSVFVHPDHLLCVGMAYRGDHAVVLGENALMGSRVRDLLGAFLEVKKVVAHNAKFDFGVMHNLGIINPEVFAYGDTMLGHYCLDERRGTHGLKYLGQELFGAPDWGDVGFKMDRLQDAPRDVLYHYNGIDAAVTYRIWVEILPVLQQGDGLWDLHHRLLAVSHALASTESEGVAVDLAYIGQLTEEFTEELELIERLMFEATGVAHNPRSPKQLMELFSSLWGTKTSTTNVDWLDSRQEQLDKKKGKKAAEEFHYIGLLLDHRKATKLYGTYVKGTAKRTTRGRVYPTYLVHGTTTGRLACRNPNLQNVPRGSRIRRLFIPDEGNTFIQCDYKTAELRVMAVLAGDDYLKGVFADDRDLHSEVATQFWGPDFTKEQRIRAKAVVFGLNYGREAWSLAEEMGISAAEAQRYIDTFFKLIPQVAEWRRSVVKQILSGEPLISPFGRRHRVWLITNQNKKDVIKEGLAFLPQGTASDITMAAFSRLRREGYKTRIPVHDSILVEAPSSSALQVARYVKRVMEETAATEFSDLIPFPVDVEMGDSWGTLEEVKESTLLN